MADARPFHWEYNPEPPPPEAFRIEGGRPLQGTVHVSGAEERGPQAAGRRLSSPGALPVPERPRDRGCAGPGRGAPGPGRRRRPPRARRVRDRGGRRRLAVRPPRGGGQDACLVHPAGPVLLARFGRVIISNPGGDRIGRRPVNLHVDAMRALGAEVDYRNGYYYARRPAGSAAAKGASRRSR